MAADQKHIVIAGAGFGGVRAALDLAKLLPDQKITLINDTPYHCFHPDLYEVATTVLDKERKVDFKNLEGTVRVPLKQIFRNKNVEIIVDKVLTVDLTADSLTLKEGGRIDYDYLVLNFGSVTNFFEVPGAKEFSHELKDAEGALNIRNDIEELVSAGREPIHIVVAGGGFTGVELSAALCNFLDQLSKRYQRQSGKITVVEGSESVLSGMPVWAQKKVSERMKRLDIRVLTDNLVQKVEEYKVYTSGGEVLDFNYLIWTTGIAGDNLEGKIKGVEFTKRGQIAVEPDLSVKSYPNVLVVGDLAECQDPQRGRPVAATAWAAISEGELAARNIKNIISDRESESYIPPAPSFVVPAGGRFAVSNALNLKIAGVFGWILKRLVSLNYFLSILSFGEALALWYKGVSFYINND